MTKDWSIPQMRTWRTEEIDVACSKLHSWGGGRAGPGLGPRQADYRVQALVPFCQQDSSSFDSS